MTQRPAWAALVGVSIIWGSTWYAIKEGLDTLPPFLFAGVRFALATALMVPILLWRRRRWPRDVESWKTIGVLTVLNSVCYGCVFYGEQFTDSYVASILGATSPLFTMGLAYVFLAQHEVTVVKGTGVLICFAGILFICHHGLQTSGSLPGLVAMMVNAVFVGAYSVYAKHRAQRLDIFVNVACQMAGTSILLGGVGLILESPTQFALTLSGGLAIVYLASIGSVAAFLLWTYAMKRLSVIEVSLQQFASPAIAVGLGSMLRGESLTVWTLVGGALVLVGIVCVNGVPFSLRRASVRVENQA